VSESNAVLIDVDEGIATITLNRPEARNAINRALGVGLARAVAECEERDDVAAMILTGSDPAFCAGADLKEMSAPTPGGASEADPDDPYRRDEVGKYAAFRGPFPPHTKPLIGAINGPCITGGFEIALNCDFLIASERARFADTHARVGIMPGWGLTVLLVESIGVRRARELSATGNFIDAATALAWGLVNHVVPHDDLIACARAIASGVVGNDHTAVARMFATYDEIVGSVYDESWAIEDRVNRAWLAGGIDAGEVARRREAIVERGRTQL